jgi:integrase
MAGSPSRQPALAPVSPQVLRLFDPTQPPPEEPDDDPKLSEAFERWVLPDLIADGIEPATIAQYRTDLVHWNTRTSNPGIHSATKEHAGELRKSMIESGEHAPETINKTFRGLRRIFRRLCPKTDSNPEGKGIIAERPRFKPVKGDFVTSRRDVRRKDFAAMYQACASAKKLRGAGRKRTPEIWRGFLVMSWFYGLRTFDLARLEWSNVILSAAHPRIPNLSCESGWLRFTTKKTKTTVILPLTPIARDHLLALQCHPVRVFPIPQTKRNFYPRWKGIADVTATEAVPRVCVQDMRVTCSTNWEQVFPGMGRFVLGQRATGDVNATYYRHYASKMLRRMHRFPQPPTGPVQKALY